MAEAACALASVVGIAACVPAWACGVAVAGAASAVRSEVPALVSAAFASIGGLSACGCAVGADASVAQGCAGFAFPGSWPILETSLAPCAVAAALNEVFGVPWSTAAIRAPLVLASVAVESVVPVAASASVAEVSASTLALAVLALLSPGVAVSVLVPAICALMDALAAMPAAAIVSGEEAGPAAWFAVALGSTGTATTSAFGSGTAACVASICAAAAVSTAAARPSVPSALSALVSSDLSADLSADLASDAFGLSLVLLSALAASAVESFLASLLASLLASFLASFLADAELSASSLALLCENWSPAARSRGLLSEAKDDESGRRGVSCAEDAALSLIAWVLLSTSEPKESLDVSFGACDRAGFCCALWTCTLAATSDVRPTTGNPLETSSP